MTAADVETVDSDSGYCGCLTLKGATLLCAYVNLLTDILYAYLCVLRILSNQVYLDEMKIEEGDVETTVYFTIVFLNMSSVIANLTFSVVLVVGIHRNNRTFINSYLICTAIFIAVNVLIFPSNVIAEMKPRLIVGEVVGIIFSIYSLLLARDYVQNYSFGKKPSIEQTA